MTDVHNTVAEGAVIGGGLIQGGNFGGVDFDRSPRQTPTVHADETVFGPDHAQGIRMLMEAHGKALPVLDEGETTAVVMLLEILPQLEATAVFAPAVQELVTRLRTRANLTRGAASRT